MQFVNTYITNYAEIWKGSTPSFVLEVWLSLLTFLIVLCPSEKNKSVVMPVETASPAPGFARN